MPTKQEDRRQIMIPADLWDRVGIIARTDMTSASGVVRTALKEYIARRVAEARAAKAPSQPAAQPAAAGSSS